MGVGQKGQTNSIAGFHGVLFVDHYATLIPMGDQTVVKQKKPSKEEQGGQRVPCLIVVEGGRVGEVFQLPGQSAVIGRGETSDILLWEEGVSRQHARIDSHEKSFTITDLKSTNGTFVNAVPIEQMGLSDGDKVRIGEVLLRFSFQDSIDVSYQEKLRNMAMRDGLTRIFNRRYFLETLDREVKYAIRLRQPLTLLMLDLDHFKRINDKLGHQAGDMVLLNVAQIISKELRAYDSFARYGGEEFVVLLRATPMPNGLVLAERLRKVIERAPIVYENKEIKTTLSVGVATLDPDQGVDCDALIKEADRYLYEAKSKGRNQVCSPRHLEE